MRLMGHQRKLLFQWLLARLVVLGKGEKLQRHSRKCWVTLLLKEKVPISGEYKDIR